MTGLSRRSILVGMAAWLSAAPPAQAAGALIPRAAFESIERDLGGKLGVFALDTETGRASGWAEDARFPLNSTFKFLLAAAVLLRVSSGDENLQRRVPIRSDDLVAWSPVVSVSAGSSLTIRELCRAVLTQSDNAAANLLLASLGGPAGLTAVLRGVGDTLTRLDRIEPGMNDVAPGDPRDTTTPRQIVEDMQAFLFGDLLDASGKALLAGWMADNTTGGARIRAGVPDGWAVGDRTGTGRSGQTSTIAAIYPPDRAPLLMAVYVSGSPRQTAVQDAAHAELARIAAGNVVGALR